MAKDNKFEWDQFCRLGEMIGDGLHHEEKWISKEYKRLSKILLPLSDAEKEYNRKARKSKNKRLDEQLRGRLKKDRCICLGRLKQTRSGSKTVVCTSCGKKYRYKYSKKKH